MNSTALRPPATARQVACQKQSLLGNVSKLVQSCCGDPHDATTCKNVPGWISPKVHTFTQCCADLAKGACYHTVLIMACKGSFNHLEETAVCKAYIAL